MCGVAGYWRLLNGTGDEIPIAVCVRRMTDRLAHRGPDDEGAWTSPDDGLALGHRRLSIIDLSEHGHQPMTSSCGRYVIVFNGEIYNYQELRKELEPQGHSFSGHSDTEVLLAAVNHWGVREATRRFNGMFAFALWDRKERRLHLARDRLGKKPLYFGRVGTAFSFASELKAFRDLPGFIPRINRKAVDLYLQLGYVPAPYCIHEGIHKLLPGTILSLDAGNALQADTAGECFTYWSAAECAQRGAEEPFEGNDDDAIDALEAVLGRAVGLRLSADVPLAAFLSGGIDSSLVVSLMQARSPKTVSTYSMGFGESGEGETAYAREIARHLGTQHMELHVTNQEAISTVPQLPQIVDEPLGDFAQVPNYLIAMHARRSVTVALSGDGGDELFCGYSRFADTAQRWRRMRRIPLPARDLYRRFRLRHLQHAHEPDSGKWKSALRTGAASIDEFYFHKVSHWIDPGRLFTSPVKAGEAFADGTKWPKLTEPAQRLLLLDSIYGLPDQILTKVDRTSMASGLEIRSPLLDYQVSEFAWRLPMRMKLRGGQGKWILRELLARHVPRPLFERPKQGFGAPIGHWLSGPLREWADDLLSRNRLLRQGLVDADEVQAVWRTQDLDRRSWQQRMWSVLMLQAWLDTWA